jgi:hypothetical protein
MIVSFDIGTATARLTITHEGNIGPEGWYHAEVTGLATDETAARTVAEEIKKLCLYGRNGRDVRWRVPFEYKQGDHFGVTTPTRKWRLFGRFLFCQKAVASEPSPPIIDPSPEPLD